MYIIDMRNGKKTYNVNVVKTVDFHSVILPLVLFGLGILVPVITDEFLVIALSFAPFYGYMFWNEKKFNESSIFVSRFVFAVSFVLGFVISVLSYHDVLTMLDTAGSVLLVNVVPSFSFMVYVIVKVGSRNVSVYDYSPPSS